MTSALQPLDAGIIRNVKAFYRKLQIQEYLRLLKNGKTACDLKITIKRALYLLSEAWKGVTEETIINCWRHCVILSSQRDETEFNPYEAAERNVFKFLKQLASSLGQSLEISPQAANELIDADVSKCILVCHF